MAVAQLILKTKTTHQGGVVEIVVWLVPQPVPPSEHPFKYRLVFIRESKRVVGYDNERGKGDHKHLGTLEVRYKFVDIETLMADFLRDVEAKQ
jgi:Family of unknown function (DUF6516)